MKKTKIIGIALSALILGSCATSSDVVDGGLFQKRKYNKGWNINKKTKIITPTSSQDMELVFDNSYPSTKTEAEVNLETVKLNQEENVEISLNTDTVSENTDLSQVAATSASLNKVKHHINESSENKASNNVVFESRNNRFDHDHKIIRKISNNIFSKSGISNSNKTTNESILNLILAVILVIAIIMLLSFIDGLLGGLLSLVLLIVIVILLLRYFGIL